jgi:hypothetical protein
MTKRSGTSWALIAYRLRSVLNCTFGPWFGLAIDAIGAKVLYPWKWPEVYFDGPDAIFGRTKAVRDT